jgi:transcriptional regulator with XRE-family HTH domain
MDLQTLGHRLRELRRGRGLSQAELARRTGISSSFLSVIEQGSSDVSIGRLTRLAEFYDVPLPELLGGTPGPHGDLEVFRLTDARHLRSDVERADVYGLVSGRGWDLAAVLMDLDPEAELDNKEVNGREILYFVLDGLIELGFDEQASVRLRRNEGASIRAVAPHRLRNPARRRARVLGLSPGHPFAHDAAGS